MRKFSIQIFNCLDIWYDHYLSTEFISKIRVNRYYFKENYPTRYLSRGFDKPAWKWKTGVFVWKLDNEWYRAGKPAVIWPNGDVFYYENGEWIR